MLQIEIMCIKMKKKHKIEDGEILKITNLMEALIASWTGPMVLYELEVFDPSNHVLDPMWRQGIFVILSVTRLAITNS